MKKNFLFLFSILFLMFFVNSISAQVWNDIYNCQELQNYVNQDLDGNYRLINDIDCNFENFIPIGNGQKFTGIFNGNGYIIENIYIDRNQNYVGLFERNNGTIINVKLFEVYIYADDTYGYVSATGGLAGINFGTIINSYVKQGTIIGGVWVGGLVGVNDAGTPIKHAIISNSYSSDIIIKTGYNISTFPDSVCSGLVGDTGYGEIYNSYSANVIGYCSNKDGFSSGNGAFSSGNFWDITKANTSYSSFGTPKTTAQMKNILTFSNAGWNITTYENPNYRNYTWVIDNGLDYPLLTTYGRLYEDETCILNFSGLLPYRKDYPAWNDTYDMGGWTGIEAFNFSINTRYGNYNKIQVKYWDDEFYGMVYLTLNVPNGSPDIASGTLYAGLFNYLSGTNQKLTIKTNNKEYYSTFWLNISNPCGSVEDNFNINISLFPVAPIIIQNFSDYYNLDNYTEEEPLSLYMKDYFSSYYYLPTYWGYYTQITAEFQGKNWTINNPSPNYFCDTSTNLEICFSKVGGDVKDLRLIFYSQNITTNSQMKITASNEFGSISQTFYILAEGGVYAGEGYFGRIVNLLGRMFPSYLELTLAQRFSYAFITMLIASVVILAISGSFKTGVQPIALYVVALLNIILFIYFIAIKYINIGTLILFALIGVSLLYFKLKK